MSDQQARSVLPAHHDGSPLADGGNSATSAWDSLQTNLGSSPRRAGRRPYVTRARVATVGDQLNGHQRAILADVGRLGTVTGSQLRRLHYSGSPATDRLARKHIGQLVHWQVLTRLGRVGRDGRPGTAGYAYGAGIVGQRLLDPGRARYFPRWKPRPNYLRHGVAVSELYVNLRTVEKEGQLELVVYDTEPFCWRRYFGPGGARSVLKPDALAVVGVGAYEYRFFVEMDCNSEHGPQIAAKAKAYVRYWQTGREQAETGIFPYVLWAAPDRDRVTFLIDALSKLAPEHWRLFTVSTAAQAPDWIATGSSQTIDERKELG